MTLDALRNMIANMADLPGDMELVIQSLGDTRLRDCFIDFETVCRDDKDKWSGIGTPVILVCVDS